MYNSQYYTCEQIDERLLQGYLDDYNSQTGQSLTKAQFLTKLGSIFSKEGTIDNTLTQIGYYECDTAAGTAAKVITVANYSLFAGGSMKVKFVNKNTANNATLNINSQGAKALYYNGVRVSSTNTWDADEVVEIYYDGTSYYANNVKGSSGDGVFDISVYNLTEGQPTKYASLSEALGTNGQNVPVQYRKGGMSVKFVQSSDNKYIRYNLIADEFTTDVTKWAIDDVGVYVEEPEFVYVKTDAEDKILWAIRTDGDIFYGAGVPSQVVNYINKKITELSLDEYEDIVVFLNNLEKDDKTLQDLLDEKVDKVEGKELSTNDYTDADKEIVSVHEMVDSPEYFQATTDSDGKILEGISNEGKKVQNLPIDTPAAEISYIDNPEWLQVTSDEDGKIIEGIRKNGSKYTAKSDILDKFAMQFANVKKFIATTKEELEEEIAEHTIAEYLNASEYNVYRQAYQLWGVRWTPKKQIRDGEGSKPAGVEVRGIPYSSVKECLKYIGIDVSLHTFMTAVNDEHSLFYTESPDITVVNQSAYGIQYYGVHSFCYYGSVCSGFVTTALGLKTQWDSWDYQTVKERFEVLGNQDVQNVKVGDILSMKGHCVVIVDLIRDEHGIIKTWVTAEHSAPTHITTMDYEGFRRKINNSNIILCRYKNLQNNTNYKTSPFILLDGETLYSKGDYMFIDGDSSRTYYSCKVANSDSTFIPSKWEAKDNWTSSTLYAIGSIIGYKDTLYKCIVKHTSTDSFDADKWEKVKGVFEWCAYPYVYNNDIVTFAGDRACFRNNDLIYINYNKGNYTQMQLYKDGELYETYNLPSDDSFQINVSQECANAGMYKARLTDGTNYSKFTYFEVIDTQVSASIVDGVTKVTFSSSNGKPLMIEITEHSGYPVCRIPLYEDDIERGEVECNILARFYTQRCVYWDAVQTKENLDVYARVVFEGEYGNATNEMIYVDTIDAITGNVIQPNVHIDLGQLSDNQNIFIADRLVGNEYSFNFKTNNNPNIQIMSSIGLINWMDSLSSLEANSNYFIKIDNSIGKIFKI